MKSKLIAFVPGDGSAPEMMEVAWRVAVHAATLDNIKLEREYTPMGWAAYEEHGDTLPPKSLSRAMEIGTIFFGGVGDPKLDNTIGVERPEMKPEARALLTLRARMGLLHNYRPMNWYPELAHLSNLKPELIPSEGIKQVWIRFLLQDSYFGNRHFLGTKDAPLLQSLGVKLKENVTGDEETVVDLAFYTKEMLELYFRGAFEEARKLGLPVISIDKSNVMARYDLWRRVVTRIGKDEFPDVQLTHQLVDSANALLFTPAKLHGVIVCGNEHGDILSDGAAGALGSMGMMCSSAINPTTGAAMFESGAGTAPDLAGQNKANPLGRILTGGMKLRHVDSPIGAKAIEDAVREVLRQGYRTADIAGRSIHHAGQIVVGTVEMGELVLGQIGS